LAIFSNYPGLWTSNWLSRYGGYGGFPVPTPTFMFVLNLWMVATSAIEWIVIVLLVRKTIQKISNWDTTRSTEHCDSRTCSDLAFHSPMRVRRGSCRL